MVPGRNQEQKMGGIEVTMTEKPAGYLIPWTADGVVVRIAPSSRVAQRNSPIVKGDAAESSRRVFVGHPARLTKTAHVNARATSARLLWTISTIHSRESMYTTHTVFTHLKKNGNIQVLDEA